MGLIWFWVAVMIVAYVIFDGFDIGLAFYIRLLPEVK
jgi:cytochrome bd-type quinol oxidase subunit 2